MKTLKVITALISLMAWPAFSHAASDDVSVDLKQTRVSAVLDLYQAVSGQTVTASSEVKATTARVSAKIEMKPKGEALRILEDALLKQAAVVLVREANGGISARTSAAQK